MKEEKLRALLAELEDDTTKKEIVQLCRKLTENFARYQQEQLDSIRENVEKQFYPMKQEDAIEMFCCKSEETEKWSEWFTPLLTTGRRKITWGEGVIERVYIQADEDCIKKELEEHPIYPAIIHTNYETYPVTVMLQEVTDWVETVEKLNRLQIAEGVDLPEIADCHLRKFYDICFVAVNDRLRQDEVVEGIEVEWGNFEQFICCDKTLLWNVREIEVKEKGFPAAVPQKNTVTYRHELMLPRKDCAYLVEVPDTGGYQVFRDKEKITVHTPEKRYQNWKLYEIIPCKEIREKLSGQDVVTNRIKHSILEELAENRRIYTEAELYRNLSAYEMANYFSKIELSLEGEILFFPNEREHYLNCDVMKYIVKDMSLRFRGVAWNGILMED